MAQTLPLPKYHQIYLVLREQLAEGRFDSGVPGELRLMKDFGVARVTVLASCEIGTARLNENTTSTRPMIIVVGTLMAMGVL